MGEGFGEFCKVISYPYHQLFRSQHSPQSSDFPSLPWAGLSRFLCTLALRTWLLLLSLRLLVHVSGRFAPDFVQIFNFRFKLRDRGGLGNAFQFLDRIFQWFLLVSRNLIAEFLQLLLALEDKIVRLISRFHVFLACLVVGSVLFGGLLHSLDFLLAQTARRSNSNALLLARRLIFCGDVENSIRVNIE